MKSAINNKKSQNTSNSQTLKFVKTSEQRKIEEDFKTVSDRLQISINKMPIAYILWDENKSILEWNEAAEKIFGYSKNEIIGKSLFDAVASKDILHHLDKVVEDLFNGIPSSYSEKNNSIRKDGQNITCLWHNTPIFDSYGDVTHILSMAQNVTKALETEEALKVSEEKYRDLVESNPYGIQVIDINGNITYFNNTLQKIFGYTKEELQGKSIFDFLITEKDRKDLKELLPQLVMEQPEPEPFIQKKIRKDGKFIDLDTVWTYQRDNNNNVIGFTSIVTDITKKLQTEITLKENEKLLRKITENFPNAFISVINKDYIIQFTSGQEYRKQNIDPDQFLDKNMYVLFGEKTNYIRQFIDKAFQGKNCTYELFTDNQYQIHRVVPLQSEDGLIHRILLVVENNSEQKRNEKAIKITNDILKLERKTLEEKNIALKELISEIEIEKNKTKIQIKANYDKTISPLLEKMSKIANTEMSNYINLLKNNLSDITSPFINQLENKFQFLSPREIEICNMIKSGLSSKEIASTLNTSVYTVNNQRQQIRKKLNISGSNNNLVTFLQSIQ